MLLKTIITISSQTFYFKRHLKILSNNNGLEEGTMYVHKKKFTFNIGK